MENSSSGTGMWTNLAGIRVWTGGGDGIRLVVEMVAPD